MKEYRNDVIPVVVGILIGMILMLLIQVAVQKRNEIDDLKLQNTYKIFGNRIVK